MNNKKHNKKYKFNKLDNIPLSQQKKAGQRKACTGTEMAQVIIHVIPYSAAAAAAKSLQSCLTLCGPTDGSPPGSPVPGILQARTLEWVAISLSNA